jgi:antitoxin MazE
VQGVNCQDFVDFIKSNNFVITTIIMEISVIPIGNSKGIRLSKTIIEKYKIKDSVELILQEDCIILQPKTKARTGWDKAFKKMHDAQDDKPIMPDVFEDENFEEWT